jgi:hypothetical protein
VPNGTPPPRVRFCCSSARTAIWAPVFHLAAQTLQNSEAAEIMGELNTCSVAPFQGRIQAATAVQFGEGVCNWVDPPFLQATTFEHSPDVASWSLERQGRVGSFRRRGEVASTSTSTNAERQTSVTAQSTLPAKFGAFITLTTRGTHDQFNSHTVFFFALSDAFRRIIYSYDFGSSGRFHLWVLA